MLANLLTLAVALVVLTFGAEFLVRGAAGLAKRFGLSSFFIGLTIVGFGTSTPELATGIMSAMRDLTDINLGNVVGSNICNIALILGITALICPIPIAVKTVRTEVLIVIAVAFVPFLTVFTGNQITRPLGVILLAALVGFVVRGYIVGRREAAVSAEAEKELEHELGLDKPGFWVSLPAQIGFVAIGLGMLVGGSHFLVGSSVEIARGLGVSELVIGLTIVAFGTSAPELFTSLVAAVRGQSDISVGNILGSNIFNVLGILSITSFVSPQTVSRQVLLLDTPVMLAASLALLPIMFSKHRISRGEGVLLLTGYAAYTIVLFAFAPGWFGA